MIQFEVIISAPNYSSWYDEYTVDTTKKDHEIQVMNRSHLPLKFKQIERVTITREVCNKQIPFDILVFTPPLTGTFTCVCKYTFEGKFLELKSDTVTFEERRVSETYNEKSMPVTVRHIVALQDSTPLFSVSMADETPTSCCEIL